MNIVLEKFAEEAFKQINDISSEGIADIHTFKQEWFRLYSEKFAELIIRKCASISRETQDFYDKHNDGIINTEIDTMIKHHFGVKD